MDKEITDAVRAIVVGKLAAFGLKGEVLRERAASVLQKLVEEFKKTNEDRIDN